MANTWTYTSDDVVLKLPADLPKDGALRAVRYESAYEAFRHALALYGQYFVTIAGIFLVPLFVSELIAWAARLNRWMVVDIAIRWIATVIAFAPLVYAVSDVCVGNRPRVRRSYQRAGWRTVLRVVGACAIATLVIVAPFVVTVLIGMATGELVPANKGSASVALVMITVSITFAAVFLSARSFIRLLFVPVIIVVEPRIGLKRALGRSRWLGAEFLGRTLTVVVVIALMMYSAGKLVEVFQAGGMGMEIIGILLARLIWPVPFIATTLIYYDLRARKEGYGIVERPENLR
jgi:hypothetical protein